MKREIGEAVSKEVQWLLLPLELWQCILLLVGEYYTVLIMPCLSTQWVAMVRQAAHCLSNQWTLCDCILERVPNVRILTVMQSKESHLSHPSRATLTGLTSLSLRNELPYFAKYILTSLVNLTHLECRYNLAIPKTTKLRSLELWYNQCLTLERLSQLTCLERLTLISCKVYPSRNKSILFRLPRLTSLKLISTLTDFTASIANIEALTRLSLQDQAIPCRVGLLGRVSSSLIKLTLSSTEESLPSFPNVTRLRINDTKPLDSIFFQSFPVLDSLSIGQWSDTTKSFVKSHLPHLTRLTTRIYTGIYLEDAEIDLEILRAK